MFPVGCGSLDELVGVARAKDLIADLVLHGRIDEARSLHEPIRVPETTSVLRLIERLRHSRGHLALITDEFDLAQGVVTPLDVFEAVAGEFPDEDESLSIQPLGENRWQVEQQCRSPPPGAGARCRRTAGAGRCLLQRRRLPDLAPGARAGRRRRATARGLRIPRDAAGRPARRCGHCHPAGR
jgi:hypothetical protein